MVEQITSFRTSDGETFGDALKAWQHELALFLVKHGAGNLAIATKIAREASFNEDIAQNLHDITEQLVTFAPCAPPPCAPGSMESTFCVHNVALTHICPQCPPVGERIMSLPGLHG